MQAARRGRFITFEGVDGAGKSTQLEAVARALADRGIELLRTREPGGTPLGEGLRAMMLGQSMAPMTETLLMFAARMEHVGKVIGPALHDGRWVLCDRFIDASYAYQGGGRGIAPERLDVLASWVDASLPGGVRPDLTVLVDLDPALARRRREQARTADRFELESGGFFDAVRAAYLQRARAEPGRFLTLDGAGAAPEQTARVLERLEPWLA
jgi:dTMP kinase